MNLNFIEEMWVWVPIKKYVRDDVDSVSEHGGHHSADTSSALMKLKTSFPFDYPPFHTRDLMCDLFGHDEHHLPICVCVLDTFFEFFSTSYLDEEVIIVYRRS